MFSHVSRGVLTYILGGRAKGSTSILRGSLLVSLGGITAPCLWLQNDDFTHPNQCMQATSRLAKKGLKIFEIFLANGDHKSKRKSLEWVCVCKNYNLLHKLRKGGESNERECV